MTERDLCDACFGTGVAGHSDSDFTCYKCRGIGVVMTEQLEICMVYFNCNGDAYIRCGCTEKEG